MNDKSIKSIKQLLPLSICCLIPILLVLAVPMISSFTPVGGKLIYFIAPLICPILMGTTVFMLFKSTKSPK